MADVEYESKEYVVIRDDSHGTVVACWTKGQGSSNLILLWGKFHEKLLFNNGWLEGMRVYCDTNFKL